MDPSCPRLVPVGTRHGGRCSVHRMPARRIRTSYAWQKLSAQVRAPGVCEGCGAHVGPGNLEADHIVPASLRPDLALYPPNVRALCRACHLHRDASPG